MVGIGLDKTGRLESAKQSGTCTQCRRELTECIRLKNINGLENIKIELFV